MVRGRDLKALESLVTDGRQLPGDAAQTEGLDNLPVAILVHELRQVQLDGHVARSVNRSESDHNLLTEQLVLFGELIPEDGAG